MLQKGLVLHFTCDARDVDGSRIRDRSAYDRHGIIHGTPTVGAAGIVGGGLLVSMGTAIT
jgi:hypothetical protein